MTLEILIFRLKIYFINLISYLLVIMKVPNGKLYSLENTFKLFVCNVPICVPRLAVDTYAF